MSRVTYENIDGNLCVGFPKNPLGGVDPFKKAVREMFMEMARKEILYRRKQRKYYKNNKHCYYKKVIKLLRKYEFNKYNLLTMIRRIARYNNVAPTIGLTLISLNNKNEEIVENHIVSGDPNLFYEIQVDYNDQLIHNDNDTRIIKMSVYRLRR